MPILWPFKVPERGNAITQRKTLEIDSRPGHENFRWPGERDFFFFQVKMSTGSVSVLLTSTSLKIKNFKNCRFFLITPKNPYSNQATQKNPGRENFKPKKILRSSPSLEIPSTPPGTLDSFFNNMQLYHSTE